MRRCIGLTVVLLIVSSLVFAQEDQVIPYTSFEEGDWSWVAGGIEDSFVDQPPPEIGTIDGEWAFHVFYNNNGSEWQFGGMDSPFDPIDLTGMREIHMWVYAVEGSTGELRIRVDLPNNSIPLLWAETQGRLGRPMRPLFRRRDRHS